MDIKMKDVITLGDDNKYLVVGKVNYEGKTYYCLCDINDNTIFKFCYEEKFYLVEVGDVKLRKTLLPLFAKDAKVELEKMKNNQ